MEKKKTILEQGIEFRKNLLLSNPFNDLGAGVYGTGGGLSREVSDTKTPLQGKDAKNGLEVFDGSNVGSRSDKTYGVVGDIEKREELRNKNYYKYNNQYDLSHSSDGSPISDID